MSLRNALLVRHTAVRVAAAFRPPTMAPMMLPDLVAAVHDSPLRGVVAVTGGGSGSLGELLSRPGASATVLEAVVPYSEASLSEWLGTPPDQACSETSARAMAMAAWLRARKLDAGEPRELFGLGCTAALATDRPKRGDHRAFVAVHTVARTLVVSLRFDKSNTSRAAEERATTHAILAALADAAGVHQLDLAKTPPGMEASVSETLADPGWVELLLGERAVCVAHGAPPPGKTDVCLLPGSFNPPHEGHREIATEAARRTGRPVVYELSTTNVEKPPLDYAEIELRLAALAGNPVWLTRATTFVEKARVAPGAVFAVGADTIERVGRGRYYASDAARDAAIAELASLDCRFLVFGRVNGHRFVTLDQVDLPSGLRVLCEPMSEAEFRCDVSSTELRSGD